MDHNFGKHPVYDLAHQANEAKEALLRKSWTLYMVFSVTLVIGTGQGEPKRQNFATEELLGIKLKSPNLCQFFISDKFCSDSNFLRVLPLTFQDDLANSRIIKAVQSKIKYLYTLYHQPQFREAIL